MSFAATEMKWISCLLREMGISQQRTPELYCDSLSVVYLTTNPVLHNRSKHFDTDFHYVRERDALGALMVRQIPASLQLADIFTKSLPQQAFFSLRFKLGVSTPPTTSLRGTVKTNEDEPSFSQVNGPQSKAHQEDQRVKPSITQPSHSKATLVSNGNESIKLTAPAGRCTTKAYGSIQLHNNFMPLGSSEMACY